MRLRPLAAAALVLASLASTGRAAAPRVYAIVGARLVPAPGQVVERGTVVVRDGLIAAVIQDHRSGRVLMVGFMNEEAFRLTVESGFATFYSRSRNKMWMKGETSGHRLAVKEIATDCDRDALLIKVEALGPGVCHEGYESCFFRRLEDGEWKVVDQRAYDPSGVYGGKS